MKKEENIICTKCGEIMEVVGDFDKEGKTGESAKVYQCPSKEHNIIAF